MDKPRRARKINNPTKYEDIPLRKLATIVQATRAQILSTLLKLNVEKDIELGAIEILIETLEFIKAGNVYYMEHVNEGFYMFKQVTTPCFQYFRIHLERRLQKCPRKNKRKICI